MNLQNEICPLCGQPKRAILSPPTGSTMISFVCSNSDCVCNKRVEVDSETEDFENMVKYLAVAYTQFCFNREMHEKVGGRFYGDFEKSWNIILISLELEYTLGLAKILELKFFKNYKFSEHQEIIDKILNWRKKFIAHFDLYVMRNIENFKQKNPLDPILVENLFTKLIELVKQFNKKYELSQDLEGFFKQIKENSLIECNKWLGNFKKPPFWKKFLIWQ